VEHFAQFPGSRSNVMNQTPDMRNRPSQALRLVDEVPSGPDNGGRVSERYVQTLLALRRTRDQFFGAALFADPAWDILLELYAAELGQRRLSVSSLGLGAAVPPTTTIRWIKILEKQAMISRSGDPMDGRRVFIALTPAAVNAMDQFFASVAAQALLI
jgi:DNA-binding MarR family transcriptional regulator